MLKYLLTGSREVGGDRPTLVEQLGHHGSTYVICRRSLFLTPPTFSLFPFSLFATTLVLFFILFTSVNNTFPRLWLVAGLNILTGKPLVESSRSSTRSCHPPSLHVVCVSIPFLSLMKRNLITGLHLNTFHLISSCSSGSSALTFLAPQLGRAMDLPTGGC